MCYYRHNLAGPPIISWPKVVGFSGAGSLKFGDCKDKLATSSVFQTERDRGCCIALRGTYHAIGEIADAAAGYFLYSQEEFVAQKPPRGD